MTHTTDCDINAPACQKLYTGSQDGANGYIRINTTRVRLSNTLGTNQSRYIRKRVSTLRYEQQCA